VAGGMKAAERQQAIELRRGHGFSVKAIAEAVGVSPSTVSRWVAGIELTSAQQSALAAANPLLNGQLAGARENSRRRRAERAKAQAAGREMAQRGDELLRTGCMLYWAEGSKARCHVVFSNSDAEMMALFVPFLRECFDVPDERIAFSCNCYLGNGLSVEDIEQWWLDRLDLPATSLRRAIVNRASSASRRRRTTLLYGTGRIQVNSTTIVQRIYGAIQEYAGITRPEWLG
jgi:transcriptional regulator with XRE-family HTH domain